MLAVAALALGDEVGERGQAARTRRRLVVDEPAGRAQPRLDRDDGAVWRSRPGAEPPRLVPEAFVRPERNVTLVGEERVDATVATGGAEGLDPGPADFEIAVEIARIGGPDACELGRPGPGGVAPDGVLLAPPQAAVDPDEPAGKPEHLVELARLQGDGLRRPDEVLVGERAHL